MRTIIGLLAAVVLSNSCSNLPQPKQINANQSSVAAEVILRKSALQHGDPWKRYQRVDVAYNGEWSYLATRLQPVITDAGFRKCSKEIYEPRLKKVRQLHSGPQGEKQVIRQGRQSEATFNGVRSKSQEVKDAAALVADAYTVFLFGPSWLIQNGENFRLMEDRTLGGERCHLVAGQITPGFGAASRDDFIVWIGKESRLMKRFQFSLNGMDSTRGADVDVTFSEHWKAPDGSIWPRHFVEYIQRPVLAKAHDWRMVSLRLDGKMAR